jgi:RNA polymerase sigma-70 factor (ECF subfamily)
MSDATVSEVERVRAEADAGDAVFEMDEAAFRAFYDRTSRPLWAYLARNTGRADVADDLLQETYYRFLRARTNYETDAHRRNSLFRIATNLAHDSRRRAVRARLVAIADQEFIGASDVAGETERRADLARAMARLRPRDRAMLWLAYAQGSTHRDIASVVGVKAASVRLLLFRARRKLAELIRRGNTKEHAATGDASARSVASHAPAFAPKGASARSRRSPSVEGNRGSPRSGSRDSVWGSPRGKAARTDRS